MLDWAQQKFDCCGKNSSSDYKKPAGNSTFCKNDNGVPSCYENEKCDSATDKPYDKGCKAAVSDFIEDHLAYIGAVAIGIAFIQVVVFPLLYSVILHTGLSVLVSMSDSKMCHLQMYMYSDQIKSCHFSFLESSLHAV